MTVVAVRLAFLVRPDSKRWAPLTNVPHQRWLLLSTCASCAMPHGPYNTRVPRSLSQEVVVELAAEEPHAHTAALLRAYHQSLPGKMASLPHLEPCELSQAPADIQAAYEM